MSRTGRGCAWQSAAGLLLSSSCVLHHTECLLSLLDLLVGATNRLCARKKSWGSCGSFQSHLRFESIEMVAEFDVFLGPNVICFMSKV